MRGKIDLHSHSTASDGALNPAKLVQRAAQRSLTHLALTDHDCTHGLEEATAAAKAAGISLIPGVELSTTWREVTIHVAGLFINEKAPSLVSFLDEQHNRREHKARKIAAKLEENGFANAYEEARAMFAGNAVLTRGNYASYIYSKGGYDSVDAAFHAYLSKGGKAFVKEEYPDIASAVIAISGAGGIAVLAHPRRYNLRNRRLRELIACFRDSGGQAMEVAGCRQKPSERAFLAELAVTYGLSASVGSDFHREEPWVDLGLDLELPRGLAAVWGLPQAEPWFGA